MVRVCGVSGVTKYAQRAMKLNFGVDIVLDGDVQKFQKSDRDLDLVLI